MLYLDDGFAALDIARALAAVPAARRARALAFRRDDDRRQSLAAYLLLKRALKEDYGLDEEVELVYSSAGRPALVGHPEIRLSLSHCPRAVACALSSRPVGVDVEEIRPVDAEVARAVLSPAEIARLEAGDGREVEFARLWTRKEALVKCRDLTLADADIPQLLEGPDLPAFTTRVNRARHYVVSVCEERR